MFTTNSCVFAVNHSARCIAPVKGLKEKHRFLVGTCSASENNEVFQFHLYYNIVLNDLTHFFNFKYYS